MTQVKKNSIFVLIFIILLVIGIIIFSYVFLEDPYPGICLNSVDREMTELKLAIEDSVSRMEYPPLIFRPEGSCFTSSNKFGLIIYLEKTRLVCAQVCGASTDECYIMKYSSDLSGSLKRKCLNLPPFTTFEVGNSCSNQNLITSGYAIINPTVQGQLLVGQYLIRNVSPAGAPYPKLCFWHKE